MEGYIAEIRLFAAPFAPRNWQYCAGQLLAVNTNMALFSLLGTTFGGNGSTTFGLPDMRGRVAVGTGTGTAGNSVVLGQMSGANTTQLLMSNLPPHSHTVTAPATVPVSGTMSARMNVNNTSADDSTPVNNFLGPEQGGNGFYDSAPTAGATLAADAITVTSSTLGANLSSVTINTAGGSYPVTNQMPYLGMNYIICQFGIFPSRN